MDIFDVEKWAGTEASLHVYLAALKRISEDGTLSKAQAEELGPDSYKDRPPRLFSQQGEIAVISVFGSLNNSGSWINAYLGSTGYPEIRSAMIYAAQQTDIKAIILDVKSGGGAVAGVSDTADLIKSIDTLVKPVHTYSDGMIASAAYWLGSAARSITIGNVAEAGSIGVIVMQQEFSKYLSDIGTTVNVIRSGKFKALGNSAEPLSELGRQTIQAEVDHLNTLFVAQVANMRGQSAALVEEKMGQGRVFIGQQAVDVGLVDAVSNFDALVERVQGEIDIAKQQPKYGANLIKGSISMPKTALTASDIAALAAGAAALAAPPALTAEQVAAEAVAAAAVEAAAEAERLAAEATVAAKPASAEVVSMLQGQLATAQAQVLQLSLDAQATKASADSFKASAEAMLPVVRAAVGNLRVALGGSAAGVEALPAETLITEHASLAAQFDKKFKAGGVAAVTLPATADTETAVTDDPRRRARLDATRINKTK